ncbi:MAG: thiamine diphosphokinase [Tenericutes bacterium HGW-Tenericutes-1]|jgi:thiamine pyrophosphokinase|nr:MAG: thiamine diphosphokinase [Tenericutes bacterium HGW-Tenericutes-1]
MSSKVKVFCGPNNYKLSNLYFEEANEILVGVDSGLEYLIDHHMRIDFAIGDFDSIKTEYLEKIQVQAKDLVRLDKEKNMTDLAYAIDYLYNHIDYESIEVYGGIGGRVDHLLANINLLKRYDLKFVDNHNKIFTLKKGTYHIDNTHHYISFYAIEDVYNFSIKGFKYELENYYLNSSDSICVSNEGSGEIAFSKGRLLVIETDDIRFE